MSFSIIHLSDLHYKNDYPCIDRVKRLKSDILNNIQDKCYLIFSGDLVFSGKNDEYEGLFDEFFTDIYDNFEKIYLVPGNHDIDWELTDPTKCKKFSSDIEQNYLYPQNSKLNLQNPFVKDPLTEYHFFQELISKY
ncbi:MAG: metallophosphoesterase, partial [Rhodobacteraceae bacterium]|nr:metallophosphoesterase [Paracoccaceae bacterium]